MGCGSFGGTVMTGNQKFILWAMVIVACFLFCMLGAVIG